MTPKPSAILRGPNETARRLAAAGKKLPEELIIFETQRLHGGDDPFQNNGDQIAENDDQHAPQTAPEGKSLTWAASIKAATSSAA